MTHNTSNRCVSGHVEFIIHDVKKRLSRRSIIWSFTLGIHWKRRNKMRGEAFFSLVASLLCVQCHLYTDSNTDPSFKQHCKDDTCVTDEGPCFIPREKGILTRLDGVKVSDWRNWLPLSLSVLLMAVALQWFLFSIHSLKSLRQQKFINILSPGQITKYS